nr:unnamed protein product [Spirometra erinaceieuropaei]
MNSIAELSVFPQQTAVSEKDCNHLNKLLPSSIKATGSDTAATPVLTETFKDQSRQAAMHNAELIRDVLCILNSLCGPGLLPPTGAARSLPNTNPLGEAATAQLALLESSLFGGLKSDAGSALFQGKVSTSSGSLLEKAAKVSRTSSDTEAKPHISLSRNHTAYEAELIYPEALTKGQFICPNCGEDFLNRDSLAMHMMESVHSEACISSVSKENRQQRRAANAGLHSRLLPGLMGSIGPTCSRRFFRLPPNLVPAASGRSGDPVSAAAPPSQEFERSSQGTAELQSLFQGAKMKGTPSPVGLETTTRGFPILQKSELPDCEKPTLSTGAKPGRKPRRLIYQRETIGVEGATTTTVAPLARSKPLRMAVRGTREVEASPHPRAQINSTRPQANGALTRREQEEEEGEEEEEDVKDGMRIRVALPVPPKRPNSCELECGSESTSRPARVNSTPARCDLEETKEEQLKLLTSATDNTAPGACKQRSGCAKTRGHGSICAERKPPMEQVGWSTAPEGDPTGQKRRHSPDTRRLSYQSLVDPPVSSTAVAATTTTAHWNSGRPTSTADRPKPFPYVCRHCQVGFEDQTLFSLHMGLHTSSNPWQCNMCSKVFGNIYEFTAHALHY